MFLRVYNYLKYWFKGTCPECGKYTSEFSQSEDYHTRMMHKAMGTVCMNPYHDNLIDKLYECAELGYEEYPDEDYDDRNPPLFH